MLCCHERLSHDLCCHGRWVLGMSPAGSGDLLTALKVVFESGQVLDNYIEEGRSKDQHLRT